VDCLTLAALSLCLCATSQDLIQNRRDYTVEQVTMWAFQWAQALQALHSLEPQVVHGDNSLRNAFLTAEG
jgi:hypothetical protein